MRTKNGRKVYLACYNNDRARTQKPALGNLRRYDRTFKTMG
nr:MAG TPA: upstream binding factor 1 [Caudoviricetes sp.]